MTGWSRGSLPVSAVGNLYRVIRSRAGPLWPAFFRTPLRRAALKWIRRHHRPGAAGAGRPARGRAGDSNPDRRLFHPAIRPRNSRLDLTWLARVFGTTTPQWDAALAPELDRVASELRSSTC